MSCFILGSKGFLKDVHFRICEKKHIPEWTNKLREAVEYSKSKTAKNVIEKLELEAFVWNPYEQEPIRNKYRIIVKDGLYTTQRLSMESVTDVDFLTKVKIECYDFEEAVKICIRKNEILMTEITAKYRIEEQRLSKLISNE